MKLARGVTLIEVMVTTAVLGIVTTGLLQAGTSARLLATERLQDERATQLLELEAEALSTGVPSEVEAARALLAALPEARVERIRHGSTMTVRVTWGHGRTTTRELTVFAKGVR